jgi:phage/plasmid-associated DNA primase
MDRLGAFRKECRVEDAKEQVQARPLYQAYRKWAEEAGDRPMTGTLFGLRMMELGLKKERDSNNRVIYALRDLFHG